MVVRGCHEILCTMFRYSGSVRAGPEMAMFFNTHSHFGLQTQKLAQTHNYFECNRLKFGAMKQTILTSCLILFLYISLTTANDDQNGSTLEDDHKFWDRLLQQDGLSVPVQPPRPAPVPAPVKVPVPAPVKAPASAPVLAPLMKPVSAPVPSLLYCDVEVSLECTASDGSLCDDLPPVDSVCGTSQLSIVQFRLNAGRRCIPNSNSQDAFCLDCANVTSTGPFMVLCKDSSNGKNLTVVPSTIEQGEIFTVSSSAVSGTLPDSIDCIYIDEDNVKIQQNIIETSGDTSLNLKERFGAFTLMSCDSGPPGGSGVKTCLETLSYEVEISNVGPVELEIKDLDFTIGDGVTTTFLGDLDSPILGPGGSTSLAVLLFLDRCVEKEICAEIKVEAMPTSGSSRQCEDVDKYCLQTSPLPPKPVPVAVPVYVPVYIPVPIPAKLPVPVPVTLPIPTPVVVPLPVPVPVPVPTPMVVPMVPPVPVPAPAPLPVPTIPTAPVAAPKSKTPSSMSKVPSSPSNISPSNPSGCSKGKGSCSKGV